MKKPFLNTPGRSALQNENGRFEKQTHELDLSHFEWVDPEDVLTLKTKFYEDQARSIVTSNESPDLGFTYTLNSYRGCEHGCAYCYARPTHEYLGYSAGLDFESKIFVKMNAPELLREKFMSKSWKPEPIFISGITDCYQPIERKLELTRRCLEIFNEFNNPLFIVTKNHLVTRDIDILSELAKKKLVSVTLSITTLDVELARKLEPRTSSPPAKLEAIKLLAEAGIPTGVNVAPTIPGLTDHEMPKILEAAAHAGATRAGFVVLRLPHSVKDIFVEWIKSNYPEKADRVINYIKEMRGGKLYDSSYETRMSGVGEKAQSIANVFEVFTKRYNLNLTSSKLTTKLFKRPSHQLELL
ncbi:MAG: PA0069 family radical SAM protein [Bdellovibrionota bacterium]